MKVSFDNPYDAEKVLSRAKIKQGIIMLDYPTSEEYWAISYLCNEWDYGWKGKE